MKKIMIIGSFLFILCFGTAFGQDTGQELETKNNMITGGFNTFILPWYPNPMLFGLIMPGFTVEYEYMLNDNFSIGGGLGTHILYVYQYAEIQGRWYPWAGRLYAELGMGLFGKFSHFDINFNTFFYITPEIGWKIDLGKRNRWALMPTVGAKMIFGNYSEDSNFFVIPETGLKFGRKW